MRYKSLVLLASLGLSSGVLAAEIDDFCENENYPYHSHKTMTSETINCSPAGNKAPQPSQGVAPTASVQPQEEATSSQQVAITIAPSVTEEGSVKEEPQAQENKQPSATAGLKQIEQNIGDALKGDQDARQVVGQAIEQVVNRKVGQVNRKLKKWGFK